MAFVPLLAFATLGWTITSRRRSHDRRRDRRHTTKDSGTNRRMTARRGQPVSRTATQNVQHKSSLFGNIGTETWWKYRGRRAYETAQPLGGDVVLRTAQFAAPWVKWDQDPLPLDAQRIYDAIKERIEVSVATQAPDPSGVSAVTQAPEPSEVPTGAPAEGKTRRASRSKTPEQKAAAREKREVKAAAKAAETSKPGDESSPPPPQETPREGDSGGESASVEG